MAARIQILIFLVFFIVVSFIFVHTSLALTPIISPTESDFARDVRMGIDQTANDPAASTLKSNIEENQIVEGKISTGSDVDVVEVIQSMDQSDLNEDFTPAEEITQNDTEDTIEIKPGLNTINPTEKITY